MLTELRIVNFALIDELRIHLTSGFHVLTGETGAGKSILIDALTLAIGGRATTDHIRSNADESTIEAVFTLPLSHPMLEELRSQSLQAPDDTQVIVRRILSRSGRHRIYINGSPASLQLLQHLGGTVVDIHGQHDQQSLLSAKVQVEALDAFGDLISIRRRVGDEYERWRARQLELEVAERTAIEGRLQEELLRFQYDEIAAADLAIGEEEALASERQRLVHAQRLAELAQEAYDTLYASDQSVLSGLASVASRVTTLAGIDEEQAEWPAFCDAAMVQLRELAQRLNTYRQNVEHRPERLAEIEARLDQILRLKKKYGTTIEGLQAKGRTLRQQLDVLSSSDVQCASLRDQVRSAADQLAASSDQLTAGRRRAAGHMEKRVNKELQALRMDQTRLQIEVTPNGDGRLGATGQDRVEFLLSTNPGEPMLPLAKVASGGELSRFMLAIKTVMADKDTVPVLIFDEIDTGIGGAVATVMGRRLRALAEYHQVLCVTHLPQVASQAMAHHKVEKVIDKKRTVTRVIRLDDASRQHEIARMIGSVSITKAVRETAAQMIEEANSSEKERGVRQAERHP